MKEHKCYPCNGLGYHIETCIEADGTRNRVKISCACCDGTGELDGFGGGGRTICHKCDGTGKEL